MLNPKMQVQGCVQIRKQLGSFPCFHVQHILSGTARQSLCWRIVVQQRIFLFSYGIGWWVWVFALRNAWHSLSVSIDMGIPGILQS